MKNSKNKILAAAVCGVIAGSVGTSIVGNFQGKEEINSNVYHKNDSVPSVGSDESTNSNTTDGYTADSGEKPFKGQGGRGGHKGEASLDSTEGVDITSGQYTDGTYEGTASGYASGLKVQVQISGGQITDIQVVSHNETPGFCERAIETVPAEIITSQSTDVDTVSGATYSSVGIINAVNDALSNAKSSDSASISNNELEA